MRLAGTLRSGLVAALLLPPFACAAEVMDSGSYQIYKDDRVLGAETFTFKASGDSILVFSHVFETLPAGRYGGDTLEKHTLWMFALGDPDSVQQATATDLGTETIRWGSRPVQARKVSVSDAEMEFFMWLSPEGHMLRLSQPEFGLRVERTPPPIQPRP